MNPREAETLNAINKLKKRYPYAASMLIYMVIERELKQFLFDHSDANSRSILNLSAVIERECRKDVRLRDIIDLPKEDFKMKILKKCSLGKIEDILKIEEKDRFSPNRNDLMHSKTYLMGKSRLRKKERHKLNREFYQQKACPDLIRCSEKFFEKPISETKDIFGRVRLEYER